MAIRATSLKIAAAIRACPGPATMAVALAATTAAQVMAATNYVATTGCDTNTGTAESPRLTISAALANSAQGDTILVGPGTYTITNQIFITNGIAVRSQCGYEATMVRRDTTLLGGQPVYTTRVFWLKYTNAVVDGFTIADGFTPRDTLNGVGSGGNVMIGIGEATTVPGDGGILRNCRIVNGNAYGSGGGVFVRGTGTVERCIIVSNTATYGQGGGVYLRQGDLSVFLKDSLVFGNTAVWYPTAYPYNDSQFTGNGGGVLVKDGATIIGCTIVSNICTTPDVKLNKQGGGIWHTSYVPTYSNHFVRDTIVWGNRHVDGATLANSPNNVDAEPTAGYGLPPYINCYYTEDYAADNPDPFRNATNWDYRLSFTSPCLGTGSGIEGRHNKGYDQATWRHPRVTFAVR